MKKHLSTILLVLIFLTGLGLLLYPSVSNYMNSLHQSRAVAVYDESMQKLTPQDYTDLFAAADDYNLQLLQNPKAFYRPELLQNYTQLLDLDGSGVMGTISIPKIKVDLPIYHGTSPDVLNVACGHLEGTSLPVGGIGTHCVLSAHRGLPRARLFTDLDQLAPDDIFVLHTLDRTLTYQVTDVAIVLPEEVESLFVDPDKDLCTLVTCTPYGVNSHRLLVTGTRIDNIEDAPVIHVVSDAVRIDPLIVTPIMAIVLMVPLLIILILWPAKKKKPKHDSKRGEES